MDDASILAHISKLPHSRASFKQLVREMGTKGGKRDELEAALTRLAARGELLELRGGEYTVTARSKEFVTGRLNLHRDGYGFLIADRQVPRVVGDIFIPPDSAGKAMHGDRVIVRIARIEPDGRADGTIFKVLKRAHTTVVGEFKIGRRGILRRAARRPDSAVDRYPGGNGVSAGGRERGPDRGDGAEGGDGRRLERDDRQRGDSGVRGARRISGGAGDRDPGASGRFRRGRGGRLSASTTCRTSFRRR